MASWPGSLPRGVLRNPHAATDQLARVESAIPRPGPVHARRAFTAAGDRREVVWRLDADQCAAFWSFYETTLGYGALSFEWTDPLGGAAVVARFDGEPVEAAKTDGPGFVITATVVILHPVPQAEE